MDASGNEPAPAPQAGALTQSKCFICGKPIGDRWFCRLPREEGRITLCGPLCMVQYSDLCRPAMDAREQELTIHERSLHFFVNGETPW